MDKLSWSTQEYHHTDKTSDWYWIVGVVAVSVAAVAVILNNIIFAILIIVSAFTLSLFASKKPAIVKVEIDNLGVTFGPLKYPYKNLDSFWVETNDHFSRILLKSQKVFVPFIIIRIEDLEPEVVREKLLQHLPEEEHREPLLEKLLIYFGF
jgi:hypothetical protein